MIIAVPSRRDALAASLPARSVTTARKTYRPAGSESESTRALNSPPASAVGSSRQVPPANGR